MKRSLVSVCIALAGFSSSASAQTPGGIKVAALAVVNAVGSVTVGDGPWFWAAPVEVGDEYGGRGLPASFLDDLNDDIEAFEEALL